jgi:uncharacterized protein DUF1643
MPEFVSATADVRGAYRYSLTRVWDEALPTITFVLLNPSTADDQQLDPTLRRCVSFAKREGYGGMITLNLYAFRATDPKVRPPRTRWDRIMIAYSPRPPAPSSPGGATLPNPSASPRRWHYCRRSTRWGLTWVDNRRIRCMCSAMRR